MKHRVSPDFLCCVSSVASGISFVSGQIAWLIEPIESYTCSRQHSCWSNGKTFPEFATGRLSTLNFVRTFSLFTNCDENAATNRGDLHPLQATKKTPLKRAAPICRSGSSGNGLQAEGKEEDKRGSPLFLALSGNPSSLSLRWTGRITSYYRHQLHQVGSLVERSSGLVPTA